MFFQSHKSLWASTISSGTRSRFLGRTATSSNTPFPPIPPTIVLLCKFRQQETSLCARKLCGSNFSGVNQISTSSHRIPPALRIVDTTQSLLSVWFSWWFLIGLIVSTKFSNVNTYYRIVFTWPNFDEYDKKIFLSICFFTRII